MPTSANAGASEHVPCVPERASGFSVWRLARCLPWKSISAYGSAAILCLVVLGSMLDLWHTGLRIPFRYAGDAMWCQALIKGVLVHGNYLENDQLGAPFGQQMYDFPTADGLHWLGIMLIGCLVSDCAVVQNVFYLLTFPLTTLTAMFALRRFGVSFPIAVAISLLYSFLPYHFTRFGHLFLASYYMVPLMVMVILELFLGQLPWGADERGKAWSWRRLVRGRMLQAAAICVLTGIAGIYYAFFGCFLLLVAGLAAFCLFRRWASIGMSLGLVALVGASAGVNIAPSIIYKLKHGPNPEVAVRHASHAEIFGLKITQLLLPIPDHRVRRLARLRARYNGRETSQLNENGSASLGMVGSAGFLWLLGRLLFRSKEAGNADVMAGLAVLNLAALLLATIGGLGSTFNLLVDPSIRAYNRISVYLAFFAFFALALLLQKGWEFCAANPRRAAIFTGLLAALAALGILDQTEAGPFRSGFAQRQREFDEDKEFGQRMEASVPAGSAIYQLPYVGFPESPPLHGMRDYDLLRPYLHTDNLRWSYGAMKGREADTWHRDLLKKPLEERIDILRRLGFAGIYIDRAGFTDSAVALEAQLGARLITAPLVSRGERFSFFTLSPRPE